MTTTILELDVDVLKALNRIVSRFINQRKGTAVKAVRTSLLEKRNLLSDLQEAGYLKIAGNDYFPTFKLVAEIAPDIRRIGVAQVNAVLKALQNLYITNQDKNEFSREDILGAVRLFDPALDENDVIPGIFLAMDFGYFASWSTPSTGDGQIDLRMVQLTEGILDFHSAEETWTEISAARHKPPAIPNTEPMSFENSGNQWLPVDFSFVSDDTLRRIIVRDYSELQGSSPSATKSRIILAGGLIEALLLDCLLVRAEDAISARGTVRDRRTAKAKPLDEWHLSSLIDVSRELGVISEDAKKHSSTIREYRNLVHPGLEKRGTIAVREQVANIADQVLRMIIADIQAHPAE